jgi:hypothetical protein
MNKLWHGTLKSSKKISQLIATFDRIENYGLNVDAEKTSQTMQMCVLESSAIESSTGLL